MARHDAGVTVGGSNGTDATVLASLGKACGEEHARAAEASDAVDGVEARYVAKPSSTEETADVLRVAAEHGLSVVPRGSATKLTWGSPPETADLVLDCSRMNRVLEHAAGDLVVRVQPGVRLAALADELAVSRQMLALDPVVGAQRHLGTVGGTVATNASGPYRVRYGTCRDLLIGVTVVRADGVVTRSGGKVVKNVAGYDLGKLYTGSFGTLGVVTEAVFRLHPRVPGRAAVSASYDEVAAACAAATAVRRSPVAACALEVDRPSFDGPLTVTALVEGVPKGVEARAAQVADLLADVGGSEASVAAEAPGWWALAPWADGRVALKVTSRLSGLPGVLDVLSEAAGEAGLPVAVRGSLGSGVLYVGLPADAPAPAVAALVGRVREESVRQDGATVVLSAPAAVRAAVDVWGPVRGLDLMRRVKQQFDPHRRLSPGRFVGGI